MSPDTRYVAQEGAGKSRKRPERKRELIRWSSPSNCTGVPVGEGLGGGKPNILFKVDS